MDEERLVEEGFRVERVPPLNGRFAGKLVSLDHCESQFSNEPELRWSFQLTGAEHEGRQLNGYSPEAITTAPEGAPLSKAAHWAANILGGQLPDDLVPSSLYGRDCILEIVSKVAEDGSFRTKVVAVLPKGEV